MATFSNLQFFSLAVGDSTLVETTAELTATDGQAIDSTTASAKTTAISDSEDSDALAMTTLEGLSYSEEDAGSGAGILTSTSGLATGDTAYSASSLDSFAISTEEGADVAFGICYSYASGDEYQDAEAWVEPYGDVTAEGGMDTDTAVFSAALAVGIAVDMP